MIIEISDDGDSVRWSYDGKTWRHKYIDEIIRFYEKYEDIEAEDSESKVSVGKAICVLNSVLYDDTRCNGCADYEDYTDTSITCEECMREVADMAVKVLKEKFNEERADIKS